MFGTLGGPELLVIALALACAAVTVGLIVALVLWLCRRPRPDS